MSTAAMLTTFSDTIDRQDWDALVALLAPAFRCRHVHDDQTFDRDGFVRFNREYPGDWRFDWEDVVDAGNRAVGLARVSNESETYFVADFFTVDETGLISELTEVWTDAVPRPD